MPSWQADGCPQIRKKHKSGGNGAKQKDWKGTEMGGFGETLTPREYGSRWFAGEGSKEKDR